MPWSEKDTERFKKGLSDEGKKKWVSTANSVLSDCMKKGGSEEECAGKAVRIANGTNDNEAFEFQRTVSETPEVVPEETVAPKELIVLGEINAPKEENLPAEVKSILQSVYYGCRNSWIREHPEEKDDLNNKAYCTKISWDAVRNDGWEKGANGEWVKISLNEAKYAVYASRQDKGYQVKEKMHQGKKHLVVPVVMMVEGVHYGSHGPLLHSISELGKFPDSWNGIPVVINHPEIEGRNVSANSPEIIEQAVGRVYNTYVKDSKKLAAEAWLDMEKLQNLSVEILDHIQKGEPIEVSLGLFSDDDMTDGDWNGEHYEAIAKNHRPDHLALLPCSVGACSLVDGCGLGVNSDTTMGVDFVDMSQTITSTEIPEFTRNDFSINNLEKEDVKMAEKAKCTPCVKEKVDQLIANSQGKYTEDDREVLETLTESILDRIAQPVEVEKIVEKTVEVNVLSDEDKAMLVAYKAQLQEKRDKLIQTIQDNAKDVWTKDVLDTMDDDKLERVLKSIKKDVVTDYSLNVPSVKTQSSGVEPLYPVGVVINKK